MKHILEKWSGYQLRSLVETKMHCIKLLGDQLSAMNFDSQVNEILADVLTFTLKFDWVGSACFSMLYEAELCKFVKSAVSYSHLRLQKET